jgi:hypothetical protein
VGHKIVYRTTLGEGQDGDAFEAFMRERYFPAVRKGPTRVGQVLGLELWRGLADTHESTDTFLVVMDFSGLSTGKLQVDDEQVVSAFEAFGAPLERVGAFSEKGVWPEDTAEEE